jgi:hypothetical protein
MKFTFKIKTELVTQAVIITHDANPLATPYRYVIPVDSIAPSMDADDSPAQIRRMQAYQSLIGSIGWFAITAQLDLTAIHSFLSLYNANPSVGHMKSALYMLHYIHSTYGYGISFTSKDMAPMHSYIHFPPSTDVEAYANAIPPKLLTTRTPWLGIPIFGSDFWDPHCKRNSDSVFNSKDSGRKIFLNFRC